MYIIIKIKAILPNSIIIINQADRDSNIFVEINIFLLFVCGIEKFN